MTKRNRPMKIKICPHCKKQFKIPEEDYEFIAYCPSCELVLRKPKKTCPFNAFWLCDLPEGECVPDTVCSEWLRKIGYEA